MTIESYFHVKDDTYCYPDSNVLRNLLGITDYDALVSAEGRLTVMAMIQLDSDPVRGHFDTDHLRYIHRRIFKDIYDWAGEFRTVEISKGIPFCYCANIQSQLDSIFTQLHKENLLKDITDRDQYVSRLAYYFGELNAVHPFREGNGRTQRKFIQQLVSELQEDGIPYLRPAHFLSAIDISAAIHHVTVPIGCTAEGCGS